VVLSIDLERLPRPALDFFQHQHHLQRDRYLRRVAAGRGFLELGFDVLPCFPSPRLFRQMAEQRPHIGERDRIHDRRDCQRPGQGGDQSGRRIRQSRNETQLDLKTPNGSIAPIDRKTHRGERNLRMCVDQF
jgi:hypothetical protein